MCGKDPTHFLYIDQYLFFFDVYVELLIGNDYTFRVEVFFDAFEKVEFKCPIVAVIYPHS